MKKLSIITLAAMTFLPGTVAAVEHTDTVTTKSEFTAAITAAEAAQAGDVYEIVCKWDPSDVLNIGNVKPKMTAGKLIIKSIETEYDKMPQMLIGFDWAADLQDNGNFALVFENVGLQYRSGKEATSGQIVYFNKKNAQMDSIIFRNCDISNYPRTLYRAVPKSSAASDIKNIGKIELSGCRVHDCNVLSSNNWAVIYPGQAITGEVIIKDNIFYNMPYCQAIFQMGYASEGTGETPTLTFENNTVLQARAESTNKVMNNRFQVINVGAYFGDGATYNINNNIFLAPQAGEYVSSLKNDTTDFAGDGVIINANCAMVYAHNNVIDPIGFKTLEENNPGEESEFVWWDLQNEPVYTPEDAGITSWESGVAFQDAEKSLYYMLKTSPAYTMGVDGTYLGSANTYVDVFPTKAAVDINIVGPSYITYTVSPEKTQYYVDDEITITLNSHNSLYRTFNTFKGWSDGSEELTRTVKLTGDFNQTATFENDNSVLAAFDFSTITSNNNKLSSYDADIYFNMDPQYMATVKAIVCDTATSTVAPIPYTEGVFQGRPAKFGEDDESLQMPIISRRTAAAVKEIQRDYAQIEFSTKDMSAVKVSAYVGTDNNAAKTQALECSADGTTWTRLASVDIENGLWSELAGTLPAALENQDKVYVRIIGDLTNGHVITLDPSGGLVDGSGNEDNAAYLAADAFEYIGNILISADTSNGIVSVTSSDSKAFDENAPVYNMMGMKVAKGTKGLLIQNGKKFIVR